MALRDVVDDAGRAWMVYAIVPDAYDDRIGFAAGYSRGWLCFQCGLEKWRFLGIPDGWEQLGEVDLLELMTEAVPVMRSSHSTGSRGS
jgi:hypothetical protein